MEYAKLDPKAKRMWRVARAIALLLLIAAWSGAFIFLRRSLWENRLLALMPLVLFLTGIPVFLQLLNLLLYPEIEYRQWAYLIAADRIEVKKGIFFHATRIVPISRIQHVTVFEGPLARFYGLAGITINTAGGSVKIEGLARRTADEICERLKTAVNQKALTQGVQPGAQA